MVVRVVQVVKVVSLDDMHLEKYGLHGLNNQNIETDQLKCKSRTVLRAGRARCWTVPYDPHIGRLGLLLDCCLLAQVIQLLFCLIILFAQARDEEVMS